jgi:hypothetical protein
MVAYLTCGAQWCKDCPNSWAENVKCLSSDEILDEVDRRNAEIQAAIDMYDILHPEDFLSGLTEE